MKRLKTREGSVISGALSLTFSALIVKAIGLIYKIPLSYILTDEGMGYFNSAYTVYTFFYIISTAGVPKAISIMTAEAESAGNFERVLSIYKTATKIFVTFGAIVTLIFALSAEWLSSLIGNSGAYMTMLSIAPSIFFISASGVIRGYFVGRLRFFPIAVSELITSVGRLLLGLLLAYFAKRVGYGLGAISAFTMLGTTLGAVLGFIYLVLCSKRDNKKDKTGQSIKKGRFNLDIARSLIKISIPITLTAAVGTVSSLIDLLVIMRGLRGGGYSELQTSILYGNYTTLAVPMLNLVGTLIAPISMVLLPIISKNGKHYDSNVLSEKLSLSMTVVLFFAIPLTLLFIFRPYEILSILFEDSSAALASPTLIILAPGILAMALLSLINTSLEGIGKTKIPLISLIFGSLIKLAITAVLISGGGLGILGAPLGTTVSYFASLAFSAIYVTGICKVKFKLFKPLGTILFSSFFALLISTFIKEKMPINSFFYVFELGFFSLIYLLIFAIINFKSIKCKIYVSNCTKKQKKNY